MFGHDAPLSSRGIVACCVRSVRNLLRHSGASNKLSGHRLAAPDSRRTGAATPKLKLEIVKLITDLIIKANEIEGQRDHTDDTTAKDFEDVLLQVAEERGYRLMRPGEDDGVR